MLCVLSTGTSQEESGSTCVRLYGQAQCTVHCNLRVCYASPQQQPTTPRLQTQAPNMLQGTGCATHPTATDMSVEYVATAELTINRHEHQFAWLHDVDQLVQVAEDAYDHLRLCQLQVGVVRMRTVMNNAIHVQVQVVHLGRGLCCCDWHVEQWVPLTEPAVELGDSCKVPYGFDQLRSSNACATADDQAPGAAVAATGSPMVPCRGPSGTSSRLLPS
jgi:hypothetical protein